MAAKCWRVRQLGDALPVYQSRKLNSRDLGRLSSKVWATPLLSFVCYQGGRQRGELMVSEPRSAQGKAQRRSSDCDYQANDVQRVKLAPGDDVVDKAASVKQKKWFGDARIEIDNRATAEGSKGTAIKGR